MDKKWSLIAIILLVPCIEGTFEKPKTYNNVKVKYGTHTCVSNCNHQASGNKTVAVKCSIDECTYLPESLSNPQPPEIEEVFFERYTDQSEEKNKLALHIKWSPVDNASKPLRPEIEEVFFERYTDESEQKNKLALHIKWSPIDNVSLESGVGFMLNISDGTSTYSRCYNITSSQDFHYNKHDHYNNDCFGKIKGTYVKPGSQITVSITSLPLDKSDPTYGLTEAIINVPGCSHEQLYFLKECEPEGGWPTNESCTFGCNTFSVVNDVAYPISCETSVSSYGSPGGKEYCVAVNKTVTGTPSAPIHVEQLQEWYKFIDPETSEVKVALNYSWAPSPDSSIEDTKSYEMEVKQMDGSHDLTNYNKCFAVHTALLEEKHKNAEFFYDCYGRDGVSSVSPDYTYHVHLNSVPSNGKSTSFLIKIPNCVDPRMEDVTKCVNDKGKIMKAEVEGINCINRSIVLNYEVSPQYGKFVEIMFCEMGQNLALCKNVLQEMEYLTLSNTLYNISLPSSANLSIKYVVLIHGSDYPENRRAAYPNFTECVHETPGETSTIILVIILILGVLIFIGCAFLVCFYFRDKCGIRVFKHLGIGRRGSVPARDDPDEPVVQYPVPVPTAEPRPPPPAIVPGKLRIYVLFMDDHDLHKQVVHWFCCYLKQDLGLDIRVVIWQEEKVAINSINYMVTNLREADKVIVICSEGSKDCLENNEYNGDMFTPAVKKICQEAFIGRSPGKYLVGYFDYSTVEHIPELLRDQCMMFYSVFKLMKQFEQFYFRLVGLEQYQEGGIQRIEKIAFDRYFDPTITTCGLPLRNAILQMTEFVKNNPTWYSDQHGVEMAGSQLPPAPPVFVPATVAREPREQHEVEEGLASINHMHLSLPPEIPNGNVGGARRKMMNVDSQPYQVHQEPPQPQQQIPMMEIPKQNTARSNYQHLPSVTTSEGTDDNQSFVVPDTETEDLSISPPIFRNDAAEHEDFFRPDNQFQETQEPLAPMGSMNFNRSFHPESFRSSDFATAESEDSLLTNLPSNETQITRVGLSDGPELPMINEEDHLISIDPMSFDIDVLDNNFRPSGESGVFTLANIDEEDDLDIEDQFKSINQSSTFA